MLICNVVDSISVDSDKECYPQILLKECKKAIRIKNNKCN